MGFVVYDDAMREIHREGRYLGVTTNNTAEYRALIAALAYCNQQCHGDALTLYADSELVVRQVNGIYQVRSRSLKPLHEQASRLLRSLRASLRHVCREQNRTADGIVNRILDNEQNGPCWGKPSRARAESYRRPADRPREAELPEGG